MVLPSLASIFALPATKEELLSLVNGCTQRYLSKFRTGSGFSVYQREKLVLKIKRALANNVQFLFNFLGYN